MAQESLIIYVAFGVWLLICAWQDIATREVSNWLTLPAIGITLIARLDGWLFTPWWIIGLVSIMAITLWYRGQMGGADAKGWMVFGLLVTPVLVGAAVGQLIWCLIMRWKNSELGDRTIETIPGYPGYTLGVWLFGCYLISFKMLEVFIRMVGG